MALELTRSTGCASVEERNQMYRKEVVKMLQEQFALAKGETVTLRPLWQNPCNGQISTPDCYRHLMRTTYAVSVHDLYTRKSCARLIETCFRAKIMTMRQIIV